MYYPVCTIIGQIGHVGGVLKTSGPADSNMYYPVCMIIG